MNKAFINTFLLISSLVLALFLSEFVLAALNFEPAYNIKNRSRKVVRKECFVSSFEEMIEKGIVRSELGNLKPDKDLGYTYYTKPHGFPDTKNFYHDFSQYKKVLVLGDSFTGGASAGPRKGYVELLSQHYQNKGVVFFNTGIGGYAQNNQLAVLKKYHDLIKPDVVLLGFYTGNDFIENLTPLERYTAFPGRWVMNYEVVVFGHHVHVRRRSRTEVLRIYHRFIGCAKPTDARLRSLKDFLREELFYRTRVGTRVYHLFYKVKHWFDPSKSELRKLIRDEQFLVMEDYLLEMKRYLEVRNTPFYILLIPDWAGSKERLEKSENYHKAIHLFEKNSIPYLDPFEVLTLEDYVLNDNDDHWNNSGHFKAYELIRNYFGDELGSAFGSSSEKSRQRG